MYIDLKILDLLAVGIVLLLFVVPHSSKTNFLLPLLVYLPTDSSPSLCPIFEWIQREYIFKSECTIILYLILSRLINTTTRVWWRVVLLSTQTNTHTHTHIRKELLCREIIFILVWGGVCVYVFVVHKSSSSCWLIHKIFKQQLSRWCGLGLHKARKRIWKSKYDVKAFWNCYFVYRWV